MTHGPLWLRKPTPGELDTLLEGQAGLPFSYQPAGMTSADRPPGGFFADQAGLVVGEGPKVFHSAVDHLQNWRVHERSGLVVRSDGAAQVNATVVLLAHVAVVFLTLACRVVYRIEAERVWGFAYGTLDHHLESGEELFLIQLDADDKVRFTVSAYSRPGSLLTKLAGPLGRRLQHTATLNYVIAMKDLVV